MKNIVILISGRGSNMEALLHAQANHQFPQARIAAVISNNPDAAGLDIAQRAAAIPAIAIDHRQYPSREAFDSDLITAIDGYSPDLVVLAGFMRILGAQFTKHFAGRLINIHPSLLPAFPGLHTHQRALDAGVCIHGCTVHFVTSQLDHGPIIIQAAIPVLADDDETTLAARVLEQEHRIYPMAVRWFIAGDLHIGNNRVINRSADNTVDKTAVLLVPDSFKP